MRTQRSTLFTVFLAVAATGLPADSSARPVGSAVLVLLQHDAGVPSDVAVRAQAEVVRLYGLIGVEVAWVTEMPEPGRRVRVVSLVTWEPADHAIPESVLGLTPAGPHSRGTMAYVFWRRVERSSHKFTTSLPNLLAVAIAHELGHMLLPAGSHATRGLMEAAWHSGYFRSASAGLLHFSTETATLIRRGLMDEDTVATMCPPD